MDLYLIRHGKTQGNLEGRYIGVTDEPLCAEGKKALMLLREEEKFPAVQCVYCSPLKRCTESAAILFPKTPAQTIENLRECDFGEFENKNYQELSGHLAYQKWIDSNGTLPFPAGEDQRDFRNRCAKAFTDIVEDLLLCGMDSAAIVAHGGTIMSILERYARPAKPFYDWQVKNGGGYHISLTKGQWKTDHCVQILKIMV